MAEFGWHVPCTSQGMCLAILCMCPPPSLHCPRTIHTSTCSNGLWVADLMNRVLFKPAWKVSALKLQGMLTDMLVRKWVVVEHFHVEHLRAFIFTQANTHTHTHTHTHTQSYLNSIITVLFFSATCKSSQRERFSTLKFESLVLVL